MASPLVEVAEKTLRTVLQTKISLDKAFTMAAEGVKGRVRQEAYQLSRGVVSNFLRLRYCFEELYGRKGGLRELVELYLSGKWSEVRLPAGVEGLALRYSYPVWFVEELVGLMGFSEVEELLKAMEEPKVWLRCVNREALRLLEEDGCTYRVDHDLDYMVLLEKLPKPPHRLKAVKLGYAVVQDKGSALVVEALGGLSPLLDACAAPGVKTLTILQLKGSRVIAVDKSWNRLKTLVRMVKLYADKVDVVRADFTYSPVRWAAEALVDAPCSGSGTAARDPSVKLRLARKSKVEYYVELQKRLLKEALRVAEQVVYAVCSLLPSEGEEIVEAADAELCKLELPSTTSGYKQFKCSTYGKRTMPHLHSCQGFFIARLRAQ